MMTIRTELEFSQQIIPSNVWLHLPNTLDKQANDLIDHTTEAPHPNVIENVSKRTEQNKQKLFNET
jgi:hypothetical protein